MLEEAFLWEALQLNYETFRESTPGSGSCCVTMDKLPNLSDEAGTGILPSEG